jgi:tRNA-dihydrouridine synthase A
MDEPIFLQTIDQEIYKDDQVKSIEQITTEYLDYADKLYSTRLEKDEYGLPPATLMVRPLMPLYKGRIGRNFRRNIQEKLKHDTKPSLFSALVSTSLSSASASAATSSSSKI